MKKFAAALSLAVVAGAAGASAITIQTGAGFQSNLATGDDYRTAVEAIVGAPVSIPSYANLALNLNGQGLESNITFDVLAPTTFDFRAGVDFGGGGALFLDGALLQSRGTDMWWNYSYSNANQFLAGSSGSPLGVGVHTLTLYGFEGCCSGNTQVQFSTDGGQSYTSFSTTDGLPAVPEAQNAAMLLAGLGLLATIARRRKTQD